MGAVWHMDVGHNLSLEKKQKTEGVFRVSPKQAYRYSQYVLILTLILIDLLFVFKFFR